jgi:hypothetical protein
MQESLTDLSTISEVADALGFHRDTVGRAAKALGIGKRAGRRAGGVLLISPSEVAKLRQAIHSRPGNPTFSTPANPIFARRKATAE